MFSRIREASRLIAYREPETGPDAVIVEREEIPPTRAGVVIANFLEILPVMYVVGLVAGEIGKFIHRFVPQSHFASLTTIIGALGFLLGVWGSHLRVQIEQRLRAHLNLGDTLAPYFGHRLTRTFRVLKA